MIIIYLYEKALIKDLNKLFKNSKVKTVIADSLDEGLRRSSAENKDEVTLPFIVLSGGDWQLLDFNFYSLMHGSEYKKVDDNHVKNINILPFEPTYDMYIAASSSRECDMLTREIIFHYSMHPTLTLNIPYKIDEIHTFSINFNKTIRKNQKPSGLVYRTITFTLSGAYLWHNNTMNLIKEIDTEIVEKYDEKELK